MTSRPRNCNSFGIWGYLRNPTFSAHMPRDFTAGKLHGVQNLAIALNTCPKLEALRASKLTVALQGDA